MEKILQSAQKQLQERMLPHPGGVPHDTTSVRSSHWTFTDHACRVCFGRVLERVDKHHVHEVRCAECGQTAQGEPTTICCCGADCGTLGHALECFRNPDVSPANPQEIMVRERLVGQGDDMS